MYKVLLQQKKRPNPSRFQLKILLGSVSGGQMYLHFFSHFKPGLLYNAVNINAIGSLFSLASTKLCDGQL